MAGDLDAVLRVLERQNPRREDGMTAGFSFDLEVARRATAEVAAMRSRLAKAESVIAAVDAANDLEGVQRALDEWARALAAGMAG